MGPRAHTELMNPIASIIGRVLMRDSLTGALADDPVVPEPASRPRRRRNVSLRRGTDTTRRGAGAIGGASVFEAPGPPSPA
jgi:hypothetical protein